MVVVGVMVTRVAVAWVVSVVEVVAVVVALLLEKPFRILKGMQTARAR